ncbi:hypothetical protein MMC34_004202 [Xylographa carneopallida]|nr:hypothetical protein [Xylographa carneopallida]
MDSELPVKSGQPEDLHVLELLQEKRELLNREVAEFKALKDEEYRRFELSIQDVGRINEPDTRHAEDVNHDPFQVQPDGAPQSSGMGSRRRSDEKFPAGSMQERLRTEDEAETKRTKNKDEMLVQNGTILPGPETLPHEREIEFQGLFIPTYLPLLDNARQSNGSNGGKPQSPPLHSLADLATRGRELSVTLSSSATLPATTYNPLHSPTISSKLSNSAPRPRLLEQRRSSSRSDISITSLRSSLRQPKTPRSPKHVLFAIDNTVLSPSTSPVVHRTDKYPPIPFSGLTNMPKSAMKPSDLSVQVDGTMQSNGDTGPAVASSVKANTGPSASLIRSYHQLLEPTVSTAEKESEDFENIGQDDVLFSFDEDVDQRYDNSTGDEKVSIKNTLFNHNAQTENRTTCRRLKKERLRIFLQALPMPEACPLR